ncbi:MAG TPA: energy-coupling factor transporter transmembrane component T [Eubacteriales bacterium]|nr:energy-coupling factor transporter transmembrane component T [Eubacteriales bacterium]
MNNKLVINFIPGKTTLHKMTGGTKVLLFVLFTVAIIVTFDIRVLLPLMAVPFAAIISMKPNYKPLIFLFTFMFITVGIIGTIMLLVVSPDVGMTHVGSHTVIWQATDRLYITSETLWYVLVTFTKRVASFATVIAFVLMTTPSEFASGLSFLRMPYKICIIVSLAYRTIPDIARRFIDIRNSMQMRGVELNSKRTSLGKRLKYTGAMLVPLIISSFGKVETIANAMDLRGFGRLKKRTWYAEHELTRADRIARAFSAVFAAVILFYIIYTKIINPYPVTMWCPFVKLENITKINALDTIFFLKWFD